MHEESKEPCCSEMMDRIKSGGSDTETCPMSRMCRGALGKVNPGFFVAIPGIALLVFGALIVLAPTLLVWLVAGTSMLLGIGMLVAAALVSRSSTRLRSA